MRAALLASLLAGLATGLGGVLIALLPRISRRVYDTLLGFSAGVMLAAGSITLLWPALSRKGILPAALGLLCGRCWSICWNSPCRIWSRTLRRN